MNPWHLYLMALLYISAGIMHFLKSKWYIPIIPPRFPHKLLLVYLTGVLECYLGILLLLPSWKPMAITGIILMLILFLPVHIYMLYDQKFRKIFPRWLLWLRIPLQLVLMYWAYSYY
ncbi:hypothetical protein E7Z59_13810 [Robertkochia marina]|uniref:DoxX family protein n=1 Tax=Robertkochia marina TaxID=1227945 RepID=A0A4S3LWV9_9FLAO|nr:hypothetical protein [Robertkochia marina]THD65664.1 hypothetical protein E7Z59_13810 [Robertkochia marina]TRZ46655.1 hypothetical protein D3A96_03555 [Robertkochia marina]